MRFGNIPFITHVHPHQALLWRGNKTGNDERVAANMSQKLCVYTVGEHVKGRVCL